ncbi:hypothetical protein [Tepidicaulis marinus]|uniref:hypothetical protein n=1 Tax=Tepidicaulis marinus TaxID=1333998 RepID=UPI0005EFE80F|nr:hypothetical protein [Tepidicaulis marinus]
MDKKHSEMSMTIAFLLWAIGAAFLIWLGYQLPVPAWLGTLVGFGYFFILGWLNDKVHRYYRTREDL